MLIHVDLSPGFYQTAHFNHSDFFIQTAHRHDKMLSPRNHQDPHDIMS